METIALQELVGGALQEKFGKAFNRVVDNLQDVNTSFKVKRKITITLDFVQNENRDDVKVDISVVEKLAPQSPMETAFSIGRDLKTGEVYAAEYGKQIKGQMSFSDLNTAASPVDNVDTSRKIIVDQSTGEVLSDTIDDSVVDFRKANVM
jgi:hypothetical protein|nr:MAG TPA: hypothetical protein [Caudoviricetes sp.]